MFVEMPALKAKVAIPALVAKEETPTIPAATADSIVAVVVASSEAIFLSSLAELITSVAPMCKDPTVAIPVTLSSYIDSKAYWRFVQEVVPIPTLNLPVSNSNPSSPSARIGSAFVHSAPVPLLN